MSKIPRRLRGNRAEPRTGAVYVGPGSTWANPFDVDDNVQITIASGDVAMVPMTKHIAAAAFRDTLEARLAYIPHDHPDDRAWTTQWRTALADLRGRDLVCVCPLDEPCHADVLLEESNR